MKKYIVGSVLLSAAFFFGAIQATSTLSRAPLRAILAPGMIVAYGGSSAPSWCLLPYGQAVSRASYSALFAEIGTTYGVGDGSTTFNLPDIRGRAIFGKDNMGGSTAGRVTNAISGVTGTTLGSTGGSESMQQHTHVQDAHLHTEVAHNHGLGSHTHSFSGTTSGASSNFYRIIDRKIASGSDANLGWDWWGYSGGDALENHTHTFSGTTGAASGNTADATPTINSTTATNQNTGAGSSQNMPPAIVLNVCITY